MTNQKKIIIITKKSSMGMDEAWCEWWECPNCKEENIMPDRNYCPDCGAKIVWKLK